jgi:hypothetical protein
VELSRFRIGKAGLYLIAFWQQAGADTDPILNDLFNWCIGVNGEVIEDSSFITPRGRGIIFRILDLEGGSYLEPYAFLDAGNFNLTELTAYMLVWRLG